MKKALHIGLILVFAWLQTYQLCDASEDTAEDLGNMTQAICHKHVSLASISTPDVEYDTGIPLVVGQTLEPTQAGIGVEVADYRLVPLPIKSFLTALFDKSAHGHSPPGICLADTSPHITSLVLDHTPAHALAPPLA